MPTLNPSIASTQEVADYLGLNATQLAANIPSGGSTLGTWIGILLGFSAWAIKNFLGRDYTPSQVIELEFYGNNIDSDLKLFEPTADPLVATFKSYDSQGTATTISTGELVIAPPLGYSLTWTKGPFLAETKYYLKYTRAATSISALSGWPTPVKLIQIEIVAQTIRESGNEQGMLGQNQVYDDPDKNIPVVMQDMIARWRNQLMPYRKIIA